MHNQANNLRKCVRQARERARILAVTSGKGGVGKTSICVNLAIALSQQGARTIILDADLGLANVEVLLGLNSPYNLQQVVSGERRVAEVLVEGPGGILVVPGSSGIAKLADLGPQARQRILAGLEELQYLADFILIDTMAGIGQNVVSFAAAADETFLITTPEPSAIVDAYAMLKTIFQVREEAVLKLIVNQALNQSQARAVMDKLGMVAHQFLGRALSYGGFVPRDAHVYRGVMQTRPFVLQFPRAQASVRLQELAGQILHQRPRTRSKAGFFQRVARNLGWASNA